MNKKKGVKDVVIRPAKDKSKTMRLNHFLSNKYMVTVIVIVIDVVFFFLMNYILNTFYAIPEWLRDLENPSKYMGLNNILPRFGMGSSVYRTLKILAYAFIVLYDFVLIYRIRTSFAEENFNVGQKGISRWTTLEEIKKEYIEIPEKDKRYPGKPGILISRNENKIYIDDSAVNNLIIGTTRSGKGEMFVFPSIDIYSRAEIQPSMIICDPKVELYRSSKETLEERGYEVYLLNLDDPLHSMGFNPLTEIIETYKKKDYATAELLAQSFAYSVFNPDESTGDSQFFDTTSAALLTALIIAHIEDCLQENKKNEKRLHVWKQKRKAFDDLEQRNKEEAEIARKNYKIYKPQGVDVVLSEQVEYLPPEEKIGPFKDYEKDINMYSIINTFTELGRQKIPNTPNLSMLDLYFSERPPLDRAKLKYASIEMAGDRTKGSVYANMMAKMTIFTYENIAKMTAESSIQLKDIGFGEKPIAVFLGIPDYDRSTHFLASVFIRQVYFVLAKMCSKTSRCDRPVKFICDEFGNIPAIEAMANIITVCLGRNISFDLYIQSYSQLTNLYGDDAETIIGNCGNEIYILTKDENTADRFSKLIGNETITDLQRTGNKLSTSKTLTESNIEKPLLNVNQLITLEKGSCVVIRGMKRQDLQGNKIIPRPIYNCKKFKTEFKFRYTYLQDTFPDPDRIILSEVNTEDRSYIDQAKRVWDYDKTFRQFNEAENVREEDFVKKLKHMNGKYYSALKQSLKKIFGDDYEEKYGIDEEMPIEDFKIFIQDSRIKENDKKAILTVIQSERWSTDG